MAGINIESSNMKISLFVTHAIAVAAGSVAIAALFLATYMPHATDYIYQDPQYIQLNGSQENVEYSTVVNKMYLGHLYLKHPLYFWKRQTGKKLLKELALEGYTPASDLLANVAINNVWANNNSEAFEEAYKWARLAPKNGSYSNLSSLINIYRPSSDDIAQEDLALLEDGAQDSTLPLYSKNLAKFYKNNGNTEKAVYWENLAKTKEISQFTLPECTTIKPWQGY